MNTVIIGGSGFIGSSLIKQLCTTNTIVNLDKVQSRSFPSLTHIMDVRDKEMLHKLIPAATSCVVLLAAEHRDDVQPTSLYYDVNVTGTQNLIDTCVAKGINKIIFTSSVAVYGLNALHAHEDTVASPFNHYGKSKYQAELLLKNWQQECPGERTLVIIRPTVVFGPGNKGNVYNLLRQVISGKFLMVGKGENKKSLSYVDNVSGFIAHCLDKVSAGCHTYNYADNPDLSVNQLLLLVERVIQRKLPSFSIPYTIGYSAARCIDFVSLITKRRYPITGLRLKKFCATTQFCNARMLQSGYVPKVSLKDGLQLTINSIADSLPNAPGRVKTIITPLYEVKQA